MTDCIFKVTFNDGIYKIYVAEGLGGLLMKVNKDKTVKNLEIVKVEEM